VYVRTYVRTSVTVGVASSVANDVTMTIAGLWRYGDWQHVATGCTALVCLMNRHSYIAQFFTTQYQRNKIRVESVSMEELVCICEFKKTLVYRVQVL